MFIMHVTVSCPLPIEHINADNHRCLRVPLHFRRAGFRVQLQHTKVPPRYNQPFRLDISPDHPSWLTGHDTSTTTLASCCAYVSSYTQGGGLKAREAAGVGGDVADLRHDSHSKYVTGDLQLWTAPCTVQLQSTVCAPQLNNVQMSCLRVGQEEGRKGCRLEPLFQHWLPSRN